MRRRIPLWRGVLAATLLVAASALAALFVPVERVVSAAGTLVGGTSALRAPIDGRVERVLARAGERVRAGDPLVVLESSALVSERARCEARIAALVERTRSLRAQLEHLRAAGHAHERALAELEVERAAVIEAAAERRLAAQERLRADELVSELAYEDARSELELARLAHRGARLALDSLPEAQAAATEELAAGLREQERRLDDLRLEAAELARREALSTLLAPSAGLVLTPDPEQLAGRRVLAGEELLRIGHGPAERFEGTVGDLGRAHLRPGQPVKLRVEGYPWLLHGSVSGRTGFVGERNPGEGFPLEVALEGAREGLVLREGLRATARVQVEEAAPLWRVAFERATGAR